MLYVTHLNADASCGYSGNVQASAVEEMVGMTMDVIRDAAKQLGTRRRSMSVEALWETAKVEITLRNGRGAAKRLSASR